MTDDQKMLAKAIHVEPCHSCAGRGGFLDSTYDRTGEWSSCNACLGYGMQFSARAVYQLLGVERVKHGSD